MTDRNTETKLPANKDETTVAEKLEENYVDLAFPIEIDGKPVKRLHFRRPKGKEVKKMDSVKGEHSKMILLMPILCLEALEPRHLDEMDGGDIYSIEGLLGNWLLGGAIG